MPDPTPAQRETLDALARIADERARLDQQRAHIDTTYRATVVAAADAGLTATQIAAYTPHSYQSIQQLLTRHTRAHDQRSDVDHES